MNLFGWLSRRKNKCPEQPLIDTSPGISDQGEPLPADLESICQVIQTHTRDITEIITAINRIERKQNRWLELLNLKDVSEAAEKREPGPQGEDTLLQPGETLTPQPLGFLPGEATEE